MKVEPLRIKKDMRVSELVEAFLFSAFNARRIGEAGRLWRRMIEEDAFIFLTIAGAMVPAGMRKVIAEILRLKFADSLVITGANLVHEICETLGYSHEIGSENV
ncbi:MAG: deoxyhypusine synthase family protein, partial [Archaeoglobaceae archaeon]